MTRDEPNYDEDGIDREARRAARRDLALAAAKFADSYKITAGGIVTAYVTIMEVTIDSRRQYVVWGTGDGTEPEADDAAWIAEHRIRGLLAQCLSEIDCGNVSRT